LMQDRSPLARQNLLATHGRTIHWVKTGKAQTEHMFSGSPPLADINESRQHFRIVQERL
jgi:hypothetical protein